MSNEGTKKWRRLWIVTNWATAAGIAVAAVILGFFGHWALSPAADVQRARAGQAAESGPAGETRRAMTAERPVTQWICSMNYTHHPPFVSDKPGKCGYCGMDLIPAEQEPEGERRWIALSKAAAALMDVETTVVERKFVTAEVRMVGKVDYDETRLAHITAWVPGRLDRLFVNYTGITVQKGDHMVEIYSPDLLADQKAFLEALDAKKKLRSSDSQFVRESAEANYEAARDRLMLLGLTAAQVDELGRTGRPSDRLTIYAPAGGIVVQMNAKEGMYVNTGARIYTIADLSKVWVILEAYESDLAWLRYGQAVEFTTESLLGRKFAGTISFIHPLVDEVTRTVRVRVNAANSDGALKPGMFVQGVVRSRLAAGGRIMAPDLAGKWISPMHPEVIKDSPGKCDVCGMALVRAEALGYVTAEPAKAEPPLVIPVTAALLTGRRAIVYVEVPGTDRPTFEMRQVSLGRRAGAYYLVEAGLKAGEHVVLKGNFMIDSERQIRGLPSMMSVEEPGAPQRRPRAGADGAAKGEGSHGHRH